MAASCTATALLTAFVASSAGSAPDTIHVDAQGAIYTAAGERLVMRGLNEMFVWSHDPLGRRCSRRSTRPAPAACAWWWDHKVALRQICSSSSTRRSRADGGHPRMPQRHRQVGRELQGCINFWNDPQLIAGIQAQRRWTILNIANEAGDGKISDEDYLATTARRLSRCAAGLHGADHDRRRRLGAEHRAAARGPSALEARSAAQPDLLGPLLLVTRQGPALLPPGQRRQGPGVAVVVGEGPSVTRVGQCDDPQAPALPRRHADPARGRRGLAQLVLGRLAQWGLQQLQYFDIAEGGVFGQWPHEPGADRGAQPFGLMRSSARPASPVCRWRCAAFGVYVHLAKRVLKVGETTAFQHRRGAGQCSEQGGEPQAQ